MDLYAPFCSRVLWQGPRQPALPATSLQIALAAGAEQREPRQSSSSKSIRLFAINLPKYEEGMRLRTFSHQAQDKPGGRELDNPRQT